MMVVAAVEGISWASRAIAIKPEPFQEWEYGAAKQGIMFVVIVRGFFGTPRSAQP